MPLTYCRKHGKPFLSTLQFLEHDTRIPLAELDEIATEYRPQLEAWVDALGFEPLDDWQELMLWIEIWRSGKDARSANERD